MTASTDIRESAGGKPEPDKWLSFQQEFFAQNPAAADVISLFEFLPHVLFFAKNCEGRFVKANQPFLESLGVENESQIIGRTARDFHPPVLAAAYMADDKEVIAGGRAKPGQVWLMLHRRTEPRWYLETKVPLRGAKGAVIGLIGTMCRIEQPKELARYLQELAPVARFIEEHYAEPISMADMAAMAGVSATQFNRRFQQLLRMTPMKYLRTVRIQVAQKLLTATSKSLVEIAMETGYADQSHFGKKFQEITGMTPGAYRKRYVY